MHHFHGSCQDWCIIYFYQGQGALPIANLGECDTYVLCGTRALLRGATSYFTVYDELMTAESIGQHRTDQNRAIIAHTKLVPS